MIEPIFYLFTAKSTLRILKKNHLLDNSCLAAKRSASALVLLFYLFIKFFLFSSSLGERGETSPRWHPPSRGNGFPGPLLCQLLAAVVLQSKRCRNPFSGQCLWLRMLPPLCVCVCYWEGEIGCGWEKMSLIYMRMTNIYCVCLETHSCFASSF